MNQKQAKGKAAAKGSGEKLVRDIRRNARRSYSTEEKIRIVMEGLRGAYLPRKEPERLRGRPLFPAGYLPRIDTPDHAGAGSWRDHRYPHCGHDSVRAIKAH